MWAGTAAAQIQLRTLPADARRATLGQPQLLPYVVINGKTARLAPGAVIYDQNNRTILQNALPSGAEVAYVTDMNGDIARLYVLTVQEKSEFKSK